MSISKKQIIFIISWAFVVIWMGIIFMLSSQVAHDSDNLSKGLTEIVVETVQRVAPEMDFDMRKFNHVLRKNAHFFAYLALGVFVINAMRRSARIGIYGVIFSLLICVLYAASDELHQMFVPGRGPAVKDVLIDSSGAVIGILLWLGLSKLKKKFIIYRY